MKIEIKYNIGDKVVFDGNRTGEIVGFEIANTVTEPDYKKRHYHWCKDNTQVRYQIKPIDGGERLYGSMREESTLTLITK